MKRWTLWLGGAAALVVGLVACPQFAPDDVCGYPGFCGDSSVVGDAGDGGKDGGQTCPSGKEPKDDPTCVSESLGIFVAPAPAGSDSNAGTKAAPVATLTKALQDAKTANKPFIFVCEGSYTESVDITQSVSIWGGFKCADWTYVSTSVPKFTATKPDYVFYLNSINNIVIADIALNAIDGTPGSGQASVGAFVTTSQNVVLERLVIRAGKGADGANGGTNNYMFADAGALRGNDAIGIDGGAENKVVCPAGDTTVGGAGGYGNGSTGADGLPALGGGKGGQLAACNSGGGGGDGNPATAASNALGAADLGTLDATGWHASSGKPGPNGSAGQGGGGGLGFSNGGGGGGGAGGCGGVGGGAGAGGGGSIALLVFTSTIACSGLTLTSLAAGAGGAGATGQAGGSGGAHGNGAGTACAGGNGGSGGKGGAGGGGAGGVSVGVLWKGTEPQLDASAPNTITVASSGGTKGLGGATPTNDGIDGIAQPVLQAP
jgi:hypothetical protein